jgi:hypothetical protein
MTETATERQPTKPFHGTLADDYLEFPPTIGHVIHLVASGQQGRTTVWAWCQVTEGQPGYSSVAFTHADGVTAAEVSETELVLGPVLFKVFC